MSIPLEQGSQARAQLSLLTRNTWIAVTINGLNALMVVYLFAKDSPQPLAGLWLSLLSLPLLGRLLVTWRFNHLSPTSDTRRLLLLFEGFSFLTGLAWGLSPWLLEAADARLLLLVAFVVVGMAAGALATLAASFKATAGFIMAAISPLVARALVMDGPVYDVVAVMGGLFVLAVIAGAHRLQKLIMDNMTLAERNRLQAQLLRAKEEELSAIYDNASYHLLLLDKTGRIVRVNRAAVMATGADPGEDLTGVYLWESGWWRTGQVSKTQVHQDVLNAAMGDSIRREVVFRLADGRDEYMEVSMSPICVEGRVHYLLVEARSVTAHKRIEARLRESERRFREVSEASGQYLWEVDGNGTYQFVSSRVASVKGYQVADLIGRYPTDFMPDDDADVWRKTLEASARDRKPFRIEVRTQRPDGNWEWEQITGIALADDAGELVGFRGTGMSISEQKRHEAELIQAKEAAEAGTRAKSQFLAVMSHEIRTPMNGVMGMAELLMSTPLNDAQRDFAQTIYQSSKALLEVINEILDLSKIEAGKFELVTQPFNLKRLARDVAELIRASAHGKGIVFTLKLDDNLPTWVEGDELRLRQILLNLLGNAVKFTEQGEVRLHLHVLGKENDHWFLEFRVQDTGIGIPEERLARIFEAFQQADASTTRKYGGTGLGLAVSKELAHLMGGEIRVVSEVNRGSLFVLELALHEAQARDDEQSAPVEQATPESDVPQLRSLDATRVLLVEDNPVNQKVARAMLNALHCEVELAINGREAVDRADAKTFDLILMDCQMPEMDGYDATLTIRSGNGPNKTTPIVAMTANAMEGDKDKCLAVGMNDYLPKPVHRAALEQLLSRLRQGSRR